MLCSNCLKLAFLHTRKTCHKCQGIILNSISVICESCATKDNICSVCLKKIIDNIRKPGCVRCGRKI